MESQLWSWQSGSGALLKEQNPQYSSRLNFWSGRNWQSEPLDGSNKLENLWGRYTRTGQRTETGTNTKPKTNEYCFSPMHVTEKMDNSQQESKGSLFTTNLQGLKLGEQ